ncbi:hypothetical protein V6N13_038065 [Hibiscus sabdariffa]
MNWRKLFATTEDQSLRFFPPLIDEGVMQIRPPEEVFQAAEFFVSAIYGCNLGSERLSLWHHLRNLKEVKARVAWIQNGDQNTRYFHSMVRVKQNRHTIRAISNDQGQMLDDFDQIASEAICFFEKLLGMKDSEVSGCSEEVLAELLGLSFSEEACDVF